MMLVSVVVEVEEVVVEVEEVVVELENSTWPGSCSGHQYLTQPELAVTESTGQEVGQVGFLQFSKS